MRAIRIICTIAFLIAAVGCSKSASTAPPLGFHVTWPGEPHVSDTRNSGKSWVYMAIYNDKKPDRNLLFSASVNELGPRAINEMTPRERLTTFKFAFQKDELSRQEIEYGPSKLLGLDIVMRRQGTFSRGRAIVVGSRIYEVGVMSRSEQAIGSQEALAFLDSLVID